MPFGELTNAGANTALEAAMKFAAQRQRLTVHNIANITTPNFRQSDVSVPAFQQQLQEAVKARREAGVSPAAGLHLKSTSEVKVDPLGNLALDPQTASNNILFHDRGNRDPEALMQDLVENATTYRVMSELLRTRFSLLQAAIAERP